MCVYIYMNATMYVCYMCVCVRVCVRLGSIQVRARADVELGHLALVEL